jgi:hypothetical protein
LERSGIDTGLDLSMLIELATWVENLVGHPSSAMLSKAGGFPSSDIAVRGGDGRNC